MMEGWQGWGREERERLLATQHLTSQQDTEASGKATSGPKGTLLCLLDSLSF